MRTPASGHKLQATGFKLKHNKIELGAGSLQPEAKSLRTYFVISLSKKFFRTSIA
jgi:hypothetical protein